MNYFAHSTNVNGDKHRLIDHLRDVSNLAGEFAAATHSAHLHLVALARWAGWLHDLGKYRHEFQEYLDHRRVKGRDTQHSVYGAATVVTRKLSAALAFAVNGHHAGLDDRADLEASIQCPEIDPRRHAPSLWGRLEAEAGGALPVRMDDFLPRSSKDWKTSDELLIRILFSCLVDADYLDTERHFQGWCRLPTRFDPAALLAQVQSHVAKLESKSGSDPSLRDLRHRIFVACLNAGGSAPGLFSLTTPTGGGKTLASLAFALKHAEANQLRRVVVVIPFLSIIEQTANTYRDILGEANVVEHHSAVVREQRRKGGSDQAEPERSASELATENWDAPVIVTTAAQFLESLFARSPSRCRKLHNLARSVVIFDEVQTWPHHLLDPTLDVVRDLNQHYGASFVFCSATQPGFRHHRQHFPHGFQAKEVVEIAPTPPKTSRP